MPFFDKVKATFTSAPAGAATSRNELMVEEVRKFAQEIKAFHKEYLDLSKETQTRLALVCSILDKPLPRVYANGQGGAVPAEDTRRIGLNVASAGVEKAKIELESRLQEDVMTNLDKWIADYRAIKASHRENLRLLGMVNDQRKTAAAMNEKYQKQAGAHNKDAELTHAKAKMEEDKYNEYQQRYIQREQEVYDQLVQLIKRSALFKDGIAMSLRIFQGAFATGYQAFEDAHASEGMAAPLPPGGAAPYHVNEPDDHKPPMGAYPGAAPALPAPTDHVSGVPTPDYTRTQAGQDANPFARPPGNATSEYQPRPADPYAPPAHYGAPSPAAYGAPATGYGAPTTGYGALSTGHGTPAYSSAGGASMTASQPVAPAPAAAPGGYPSMYGAPTGEAAPVNTPSAQEKGSTTWVENAQAPSRVAN